MMDLREQQISSFVSKHQKSVWKYLRMLGCEEHQAQDLTQEVFLVVLRKPFQVRSDRETNSYLRKTARYLFLTWARKQENFLPVKNLDAAEEVWKKYEEKDNGKLLVKTLETCIQHLPKDEQILLDLRYKHNHKLEAIAELTQASYSKTRSQLYRIRKALRNCIERKLHI